MKHAGPQALDELGDLLVEIRNFEGLKEKKRGAFYRKSSGFLHFHEDPAGFFADLKIDDEYQRFRVSTASERKALVRRISSLMRAS
ncbi:MAG: hypothetical protein HYR72_04580 [Deltaproteobacteria bacterium]|nr:hypothetical protein [Deltaproteobacteria bacterium]MBI3389903.1 hypothetical protein [Deltaproteobacteria bacterium]